MYVIHTFCWAWWYEVWVCFVSFPCPLKVFLSLLPWEDSDDLLICPLIQHRRVTVMDSRRIRQTRTRINTMWWPPILTPRVDVVSSASVSCSLSSFMSLLHWQGEGAWKEQRYGGWREGVNSVFVVGFCESINTGNRITDTDLTSEAPTKFQQYMKEFRRNIII